MTAARRLPDQGPDSEQEPVAPAPELPSRSRILGGTPASWRERVEADRAKRRAEKPKKG